MADGKACSCVKTKVTAPPGVPTIRAEVLTGDESRQTLVTLIGPGVGCKNFDVCFRDDALCRIYKAIIESASTGQEVTQVRTRRKEQIQQLQMLL